MGPIDQLLTLDDALLDWQMHASPTTEEERALMLRVFAMRTRLDAAINDLVAHRLQLAVANLPAETAQLEKAVQDMKQTSKTIDDVQQVLTIVGTVVQVAATLVATVAA
jgi:hypothetical protein